MIRRATLIRLAVLLLLSAGIGWLLAHRNLLAQESIALHLGSPERQVFVPKVRLWRFGSGRSGQRVGVSVALIDQCGAGGDKGEKVALSLGDLRGVPGGDRLETLAASNRRCRHFEPP